MSTAYDYWGKNENQDRYYDAEFDYIDEMRVSQNFKILVEAELGELQNEKMKMLESDIKELCWLNRQHHKKMNSIKPVRKFTQMIIF